MFSATRTFRAFVLFSLLASVVQAHDGHLAGRDHAGIQRMMKKRSPQGLGSLGPVQANAAGDDDVFASTTTSGASSSTTSSASSSSSSSSSATGTSTATSTSITSSSNSTTSTTSSSTSTTTSATITPTSETLNLQPVVGPSTVTGSAVTRTASVNAAAPSTQADRQGNVSDNNSAKSTTITIIIGIAASLGGIAILWTIFRKWKLSSSKSFDKRLDPNWRPPSPVDDSPIPTHRTRRQSDSSFNNGTSFDHDFTAGPGMHSTPVGGYADLARGSSPNPQMQEQRMNRGYNAGAVPLHYGGGNNRGPFEAYDYNGNGVRY